LADQIFRFITEEEKQDALKVAVQKPTLYAKLITEYNGKALPKMLDNILVRNHNITERVAKEAASAFTKSAEYAGILANGVLNLDSAALSEEETAGDTPVDEPGSVAGARQDQRNDQRVPAPKSPPFSSDYLPVEIPNTEVKILFPVKYAYELSVGNFKEGIEKLAENIAALTPSEDDDEHANIA
jgi:hypothetical protein